MTQKDYIKIARVLNLHTPTIIGQHRDIDALICGLVVMFEEDNPRFNKDKFFKASYQKFRKKL